MNWRLVPLYVAAVATLVLAFPIALAFGAAGFVLRHASRDFGDLWAMWKRLADALVHDALSWLTAHLAPPRVYHGAAGPYLSRWTLLDRHPDRWRLCLHFFHRSDEDRALHTHPWRWAIALQLAGGYREERAHVVDSRFCVRSQERRPGRLVFLRADTAHRVDLLDDRGSWSLILLGPKSNSWGFYDRETWKFTPWRDALRRRGIAPYDDGGENA